MVDVLGIVVTRAEELLDILDACWNRPLSDGLKLRWICTNGASTKNVPKIFNRLLKKGTVFQFGTNTFCYESGRGIYGDWQDGGYATR